MSTLSRRGFLILGGTGAAGVALAGCGSEEDPRGEGEDPELLANALAAEEELQAAYDNLVLGAEGAEAKREFYDAQEARMDELGRLAADAGGGAVGPTGASGGGGDAQAAQNRTIAAYRQIARLGSTEDLRRIGTQFAAQVAAELAVVRELEDDEVVPFAFVTGLPEAPLETSDDAPNGETTTTTTTGGG